MPMTSVYFGASSCSKNIIVSRERDADSKGQQFWTNHWCVSSDGDFKKVRYI